MANRATKSSTGKARANHSRDFDIVLYGATGFTGQLTAERLLERRKKEAFTWAIAGRDQSKLEFAKSKLEELDPVLGREVSIVIASADDQSSIDLMAQRAKMVITTVGPYLKYGEPLVSACAEYGTDYADLTGEGSFADMTREKYGHLAEQSGARLINCAGYDSIPADIGAWMAVKALGEAKDKRVTAFASFGSRNKKSRNMFNSVSGGTWHSAIGFMSVQEGIRQRKTYSAIGEMAPGRDVGVMVPSVRKNPDGKGWGVFAPLVDNEVVIRSAVADPIYGEKFRYGHHFLLPDLIHVAGGAVAMSGLFSLAQIPPTRDWLLSLRKPGEGPDAETRDNTYFLSQFYGEGDEQEVVATFGGGDPGYGDTSKMLADTALALVLDRNKTRDCAGAVTPAFALGQALFDRLKTSGFELKVHAR